MVNRIVFLIINGRLLSLFLCFEKHVLSIEVRKVKLANFYAKLIYFYRMDEDTAFFCNFVRSLYWVVFEMLCIPQPPIHKD